MKNLTVNMPLAVPHQKPPSKLASHPYPVLVEDRLTVRAVMAGWGAMLPAITDNMSVIAKVSGVGSLRSLLNFYDLDIEYVAVSAKVSGVGELKSNRPLEYKYTLDTEQVYTTARVTGYGTLRRLLIEHTLEPDIVTVSAKITGNGVLS